MGYRLNSERKMSHKFREAHTQLMATLRECRMTKDHFEKEIEKTRLFISEAREFLDAARTTLVLHSPSPPLFPLDSEG